MKVHPQWALGWLVDVHFSFYYLLPTSSTLVDLPQVSHRSTFRSGAGREELSTFAAAFQAGCAFGTMVAPFLADRLGPSDEARMTRDGQLVRWGMRSGHHSYNEK